jgi:hypothetical protein
MESVLVRGSCSPGQRVSGGLIISYRKPIANIMPLSPGVEMRCKIQKFDKETKFKKQMNSSVKCKNLKSIE